MEDEALGPFLNILTSFSLTRCHSHIFTNTWSKHSGGAHVRSFSVWRKQTFSNHYQHKLLRTCNKSPQQSFYPLHSYPDGVIHWPFSLSLQALVSLENTLRIIGSNLLLAVLCYTMLVWKHKQELEAVLEEFKIFLFCVFFFFLLPGSQCINISSHFFFSLSEQL